MGSKNIEDLISNRTYKGELVRRFSENVITLPLASHLHVLSKQEWDIAQQILEQIKPNKEKLPKMTFLLEGLIVCCQCNKKMKVVVEKRQNKFIGFYQCNKHKYRYEKKEIELRVLGDVLREMSLHLISVKEYKFLKPLAKKIHVHIQTFNSEINHLMDEYAKLMEKYLTLDDIKMKRTLLEQCNNIRNKVDDRRERVNQLQIMENNFRLNAKPVKEVDNFLKDFNNYSDEYRAILLKNVIAEVKGSKQSIHIVYKYFDQILGGRDEIYAK
ncbi:hypothetical protein [Paenibacillus endoradicis]|uniref:hypothetical protein n=1 Tax=Paenibacillus endoradicis TaxID=2972487 RepID=UPI0021590261|nr:hypothetical protein [Paenibacillus endoradicis]MCR8655839.1 hypothetical protein [Paenibacillus endoradicis]MCR8658165.1 hypothetical protein [Paenibacillus endoradicis]